MATKRSPYDRLMDRVVESDNGCHEWQGAPVTGYSRVGNAPGLTPRNIYGHIVSYEHHHGPVPEGLFVLHSCDNRICVNPDHLRAGTRQDNMDDKVKRNRQVKGEDQVKAKLSAHEVKEIRARHGAGGVTMTELAKEYGVDVSSVHNVIKRKTWKHI